MMCDVMFFRSEANKVARFVRTSKTLRHYVVTFGVTNEVPATGTPD